MSETSFAPPAEVLQTNPSPIDVLDANLGNTESLLPPQESEYSSGRLALGATVEITPVEVEPKISDSELLDQLIHERVGRAMKSSEFVPTPEIEEAFKGFYTDHYTLKAAISAVAAGDYDSDVFDRILARDDYQTWEKEIGHGAAFYASNGSERPMLAPNANTYAIRIAQLVRSSPDLQNGSDESRLRSLKLCGKAIEALFAESSVGVSVLEESDITKAAQLADTLIEQAGTNVLHYFGPANQSQFFTGKDIRYNIEAARETFWADTRHAGQLLFTGTTQVGGINMHGLMSRNQQLRKTGVMNNTTALNFGGDTMHSVVPHFSEFYGLGQYASGEHRGTAVVPLIKIIEQAPYARDAQYGVVKLKDRDSDKVPTPTITTPISQSGAGRSDRAGLIGEDRVFFASADETSETLPDDYAISLFDKANKPGSYIVDRTQPDMYADEAALLGLGTGFGFPERIVIERPKEGQLSHEERVAAAAEVVKQVQQEYLEAYARYGVIIPLRRGVFAQAFENMDVQDVAGRRAATIYNRYTPGTGKNN
ncbi:hypothetical protein EB118_07750 [bacterium]|nr:hypothetical protein [bacterium]NBX97608.1 hypothetical protein [bacterium]NDC94563.1 hypothetical protein [bacterium]NDD84142.1 hypothetical protein [bacterium]NDG29971.1 hypothetical protein [bacterium]